MIFQYLYAIGFIAALTGLILWFVLKKSGIWARRVSMLFFASFGLYLIGLTFNSGDTAYKLLILCRDGLIMALLALFFNAIRKRKIILYAMLSVLAAAMYYGFDDLRATFSVRLQYSPVIPLDSRGEVLIDISESNKKELFSFLDERGLSSESAFMLKELEGTDLDQYLVIDIPDHRTEEIPQLKSDLKRRGLIDWFEVNEQLQLDPLPSAEMRRSDIPGRDTPVNDPLYPRQWYLQHIGYADFAGMRLKPVKKGLLAILDTGIDGGHEDLKNHLRNKDESKNYKDAVGHGTHCAGIAGAVTNNAKGIASLNLEGIYYDLMSIKVLDDRGIGSQRSIIQGILTAADRGATVISLSLGGRSNHKRQIAYEEAIQYAASRGAIVITAAGNASSNAKQFVPASVKGVICVSALDSNMKRASFSNRVDEIRWSIAAPGTRILSTTPGQQYEYFNGTSMATPIVSSAVAVLKSMKPELGAKEAWEALHNTGKELPSGESSGNMIKLDRLFSTDSR